MPLKHEIRYAHKKYTELSDEQTIVPGRLNSELCAWGVKMLIKNGIYRYDGHYATLNKYICQFAGSSTSEISKKKTQEHV